tara:strand:- start:17 stop:763 length:747 start_codon:yes stop_codon:yes gene_type:complete
MYIRKVISFGNSWELLGKKTDQINDIKAFVESISTERIRSTKGRYQNDDDHELSSRKFQWCWQEMLKDSNWTPARSYLSNDIENRRYFNFLGDCRDDVSLKLMTHRDLVNRWLFSSTPIAYKHSVINIPVAVILTSSAESTIYEQNRPRMMAATFEQTEDELKALSPLSQSHPFVIIGISFEEGDLEVIEIESELGIADKQVVINRSIEFPAEYHSAGLGILSYFGTVLREKYPDQEAKGNRSTNPPS